MTKKPINKGYLKEQLKTRHTSLHFQTTVSLMTLDRKLQISPSIAGVQYLTTISDAKDLPSRVSNKLDALFKRVQTLLDLQKPVEKVKVEIFDSREALLAADNSGMKSGAMGDAFYDYRRNIIRTSLSDINVRTLGHYMALSIINQNIPVREAQKVADIMAMYVDQNLR